MSNSTVEQIAALQNLPMLALQERWRSLLGTEPPRYNRSFLVRRLAHRLQELAYGGLSQSARSRMNELLTQAGCDETGAFRSSRARARGRSGAPVVGTRLIREWNGHRHEVTVVAGGYEYQGRRYRSLTAITELITGTHWNGPAFFGLRARSRQEVGQ